MAPELSALPLREPIVVVLGHVDVGKTTLLDTIRGTFVAQRETGGITQYIGASLFPVDALVEICRKFVSELEVEIKVPGILVIDTPGHEAFMNLRRRGGSIADLAILVVDIMKGVQEQTRESIELLKVRKTPFVVAANKIDMISGWKPHGMVGFAETYRAQSTQVREEVDNKVYQLMGDLSFLGFTSDLYSKVTSFTKTVAVVPLSAKTGEGIPDLLIVLLGLTQRFMEDQLQVVGGTGRGVVLEVVEEEGMGATVNAIVYAGKVRTGDSVALAGRDKPFITRVRSILLPKPLDEMRDPQDRFRQVEHVDAVVGVKIVAPDLDNAVPGSPLLVLGEGELDSEVLARIASEVEELKVHVDRVGVVLKADTLGTLEATVNLLRERGITTRVADIGEVSKRDVVEAQVVRQKDELSGVILAFNVKVSPEAEKEAGDAGVRIFHERIVYRLIEDYANWVDTERTSKETAALERIPRPAKIKVLPGFVFRRSSPAIFGVEVLSGTLKPKVKLISEEANQVGFISQIQDKGKAVDELKKGGKAAVSVKEAVVGRNVHGNEVLFVDLTEREARSLVNSYMHRLSDDEKEALEETVRIKRTLDPFWAR